MKKILLFPIMLLIISNSFSQTTKPQSTQKTKTTTTKTTKKTTSKTTKTTTKKTTTTPTTPSTQTTTEQHKGNSTHSTGTHAQTPTQHHAVDTTKKHTPTPPPTPVQNQTTTTTQPQSDVKPTSNLVAVWINGSLGGGAVASTNIINSGAVLPFRTEITFQSKHRRMGIGFGNELYLTPQALSNLILGQSVGIKKLYFVYEQYLFRNFPINLGFSSNLGFFGTGDTLKTKDGKSTSKGGLFGNVGCVLELGIRPFFIFVRPDIEYQSWSGLHKQIQATVNVGIKFKFLSEAEKARRAAKKAARHRD